MARRSLLAGSWSHERLILPWQPDMCVEAIFGKGVRYISLEEAKAKSSKWAIQDFPVADPDAAKSWLLEQIGKGYDYLGALGLFFGKDWDDPKRLWCSEVVEGYFRAGSTPRFRHNPGKLNPTISWMVEKRFG